MSKDVKQVSLEEAESFTRSPVQSRAVAEHTAMTLSIFHLKNLGPLATEHLTTLSPSIWKTSLVIPIHKPGKDSSQGTSY